VPQALGPQGCASVTLHYSARLVLQRFIVALYAILGCACGQAAVLEALLACCLTLSSWRPLDTDDGVRSTGGEEKKERKKARLCISRRDAERPGL
jgi:hypothetical protein